MSEYFDQPNVDLFVNTTVADVSEPMHAVLSKRIPLGDFQSIPFWVTGHLGFAKKVLAKKQIPAAGLLAFPVAAALAAKDLLTSRRLPSGPASLSVEFTGQFDDRFDAFWKELLPQNAPVLLAARDRETLAWHYASPLKANRLWIATASQSGSLRAFAIFKRQEREGGLKRMQLVDFQTLEPDQDLLAPLLRQALARCKREGLSALEQLGCDVPSRTTFDRHAPYRRKLPNWPFFYKANDPAIDAELAMPAAWSPSTYDGDASFD